MTNVEIITIQGIDWATIIELLLITVMIGIQYRNEYLKKKEKREANKVQEVFEVVFPDKVYKKKIGYRDDGYEYIVIEGDWVKIKGTLTSKDIISRPKSTLISIRNNEILENYKDIIKRTLIELDKDK